MSLSGIPEGIDTLPSRVLTPVPLAALQPVLQLAHIQPWAGHPRGWGERLERREEASLLGGGGNLVKSCSFPSSGPHTQQARRSPQPVFEVSRPVTPQFQFSWWEARVSTESSEEEGQLSARLWGH